MTLRRTRMPNASPAFIHALATVVTAAKRGEGAGTATAVAQGEA
jgi:hypothetical protein